MATFSLTMNHRNHSIPHNISITGEWILNAKCCGTGTYHNLVLRYVIKIIKNVTRSLESRLNLCWSYRISSIWIVLEHISHHIAEDEIKINFFETVIDLPGSHRDSLLALIDLKICFSCSVRNKGENENLKNVNRSIESVIIQSNASLIVNFTLLWDTNAVRTDLNDLVFDFYVAWLLVVWFHTKCEV